MGEKERIANNYIEEQKALHAHKRLPDDRHAMIIGSNCVDNIGATIALYLRDIGFERVREFDESSCDVTSMGALYREMRFPPDTLILANGLTELNWLGDQAPSSIKQMVDVNLTGSIQAVNMFVRASLHLDFRKQIIFIGSMAYKSVLNASAPYCAAKAGLAHFARCAAWELAPKGYDVFIINPSNTVGTPMTEETIRGIMRYRGVDRATAEAYWGAVLPRRDWLSPHDIAETVKFLVSGRAGYLSGTQIDLGGGQR